MFEFSDIYSILDTLFPQEYSKIIMNRCQKESLKKNWSRIIGSKLAEHTELVDCQDENIIIAVDDQKWMSALQHTVKQINNNIKGFFKSTMSNSFSQNNFNIKFILGHVPSSSNGASLTDSDRKEKKLDLEQRKKIEQLLAPISNNKELKGVFHNILLKYYLAA